MNSTLSRMMCLLPLRVRTLRQLSAKRSDQWPDCLSNKFS